MDDFRYDAFEGGAGSQQARMQWSDDLASSNQTTMVEQNWLHEGPRFERKGPERRYDDTPFQLDAFDRDLLRQPDSNSRQGRAALGQARLSLPSASNHRGYDDDDHYVLSAAAAPRQTQASASMATVASPHTSTDHPFKIVRISYENHFDQTMSPDYCQLSSPAYQASQRHATGRPGIRNDEPSTVAAQPDRQTFPNSFSTAPKTGPNANSGLIAQNNGALIVQGIELVSVYKLPDRFRALFTFSLFNAVQSKCFDSVYNTNNNFVLASPTGSGKTVIFELAICGLIHGWQSGSFKVVYMAPIKSLCAERTRDWKNKFSSLSLVCEEMTGDSDMASLHRVQSADIIVTTPEKWDSMTRKWRDHEKLVQLIKLLLIDEVHILNKDRGAALEAVVSRMKSVGSGVRFVALSATVPNSQDIATWLGRDANNTNIPAIRERFGEEFRPVKLERHVCGYQTTSNAFAFDSTLNKKLPDVIKKFSHRKPIMVFCFTRKSCAEAAKFLASWWEECNPQGRYWRSSSQHLAVEDKILQTTVTAGVAFHHAGLSSGDRSAVERAYLSGQLNVICCTSTLAVGVNLPCHMVIIKNTVNYEGSAVKEYSDLEVMQMVGRAGRPQFDDSAVAVIMTKIPQVKRYEQMVNGQELLESCLHLNLIEHLNAEVGLGTIHDLPSAKRWLEGTFLRVRLQHNPQHYHIEGDTGGNSLDERLEHICANGISELQKHGLVNSNLHLKTTEYGEAMARYYMDLETMKAILDMPPKPKLSEILSTLAQSHEFRELRFRAGEKPFFKEINNSSTLRFPIKVDLALPAHKVTLMIQAVLGEIEPTSGSNYKTQNSIDQGLIFQHANRIVRCIIDCQNYRNDAIGIRNSLMLSRSLAIKAWDDSPLVLRQIEWIGPVAVRKLVGANIRSIDELEATEPGRLEQILNRNPPFGFKVLNEARRFPRLRISLRLNGQPLIREGGHVAITLIADIGFINKDVPVYYRGKPVFVIMLAEISDGRKVSFCRISAQKLAKASPIRFSAALTSAMQSVNCYVMCDELGGTFQQARLKPELPVSAFDSINEQGKNEISEQRSTAISDTSTLEVTQPPARRVSVASDNDDWGDGGIGDSDFPNAADQEPWESDFVDIDELDNAPMPAPKSILPENKALGNGHRTVSSATESSQEPKQLRNGNWACSHRCKDKQSCKHPCCRDGLEKKPKLKPKKYRPSTSGTQAVLQKGLSNEPRTQSKLQLQSKKNLGAHKTPKAHIETIDLSQKFRQADSHGYHLPLRTKSGLDMQTDAADLRYLADVCNDETRSQYAETSNEFEHAFEGDELDLIYDQSSRRTVPELANLTCDKSIMIDDNTQADAFPLVDDERAFQDDDEEMLDAALVGCEDSLVLGTSDDAVGRDVPLPYRVTSPATGGSQCPEQHDSSGLFLTEGPETYSLPEDGSAMLCDSHGASCDGHSPEDDGTIKRKRHVDQHTMPARQALAKRQRTAVILPSDNDPSRSYHIDSPEETLICEVDDPAVLLEVEARPMASEGAHSQNDGLKAWLAAEFGDTVELIDEV